MLKRVLLAVFVAVIALVGVFWFKSRSSQPIKVGASFIGYTNDPAGIPYARFRITNQSDTVIVRLGTYHFATDQNPGFFPVYFGADALLHPLESEIVTVPRRVHNGRWRAAINFTKDNWRIKVRSLVAELPMGIRRLVPLALQGVPTELTLTDWINE